MATIIVSDRQEALKLGYEATDWSVPVSFENYKLLLKDWDVQLIQRNGENIGAVYRKNGEVHVSIVPKWRKRWATKGLIKEFFGGKVTTKVTPGHEYMHGILARLGFVLNEDQIFAKG